MQSAAGKKVLLELYLINVNLQKKSSMNLKVLKKQAFLLNQNFNFYFLCQFFTLLDSFYTKIFLNIFNSFIKVEK